jgi:hypothetical protein
MRSVLACIGCVVLAFGVSVPAHASTIVSGWYQGVHVTGGGSPQVVETAGPAVVTPQTLTDSIVYKPYPAVDGASITATALLYGDAAAYDAIHAYAESLVSMENNPGNGFVGGNAFSNLGFRVTDTVRFASESLGGGSPVQFTLTAELHSVIAATSPGGCNPSTGYQPSGTARLVTTQVNQLYSPLIHDTCGKGAELMSVSNILLSEVNGAYTFETLLELFSSASVGANADAEARTTIDARTTARLYIDVLTPGVTFTADSNATYTRDPTSVPEPTTWVMVMAGAICVMLGRRVA